MSSRRPVVVLVVVHRTRQRHRLELAEIVVLALFTRHQLDLADVAPSITCAAALATDSPRLGSAIQ